MNEIYKDLVQISTPILGVFALYFFQKINDSVSKLNENVAVVISKIEKQESTLSKHDDEIEIIKMSMAGNGCFNSNCIHK